MIVFLEGWYVLINQMESCIRKIQRNLQLQNTVFEAYSQYFPVANYEQNFPIIWNRLHAKYWKTPS